jgi:hypothetical protein
LSLARRDNETATRFFTFSGVVPPSSTSASCVVGAAIVDDAGNAATVEIGPLVIDVTAPAPVVADDGSG